MNLKRLSSAVRNTILTSAIIHLILLAIFMIKDQNLDFMNMFNILELSLIFPSLSTGITNFLWSQVMIIAIGTFWYAKAQKKLK